MGKKVYENNGNWGIITKIKKIPIRKRNWQMVDKKKKAVCKTARRAHSQKNECVDAHSKLEPIEN